MEENSPNKAEPKKYSLEELVAIGDHIHNCTTGIIIAGVPHPSGEIKVLMTIIGKEEDVLKMIVEALIMQPIVGQVIESAFLSYVATMEARKSKN